MISAGAAAQQPLWKKIKWQPSEAPLLGSLKITHDEQYAAHCLTFLLND